MKEQVFVPKTPNIFAIMTDPPSTIVHSLQKNHTLNLGRSFEYLSKVEQISEDSLDLISSPLPLVKIKTIEGDGIESRLPFKIFSTLLKKIFIKNLHQIRDENTKFICVWNIF